MKHAQKDCCARNADVPQGRCCLSQSADRDCCAHATCDVEWMSLTHCPMWSLLRLTKRNTLLTLWTPSQWSPARLLWSPGCARRSHRPSSGRERGFATPGGVGAPQRRRCERVERPFRPGSAGMDAPRVHIAFVEVPSHLPVALGTWAQAGGSLCPDHPLRSSSCPRRCRSRLLHRRPARRPRS